MLGGLLLAAGAAAIALSNTGADHRVFLGISNAATVAIFISVGAFAWRRDPDGGFGRLLVIAGAGWFVVSLGASSASGLYSIGRTAAWIEEVVIVYLFLSYPAGRPETPSGRTLVAIAAGTVALLYLPTAFLVDQFPTPSPYALCTGSDCPANALQLTSSQPAFIDDAVRPVRELLASGIFLGTVVLIFLRLVRATPLMRRSLTPVLVVAAVTAGAASVYVVARLAGAGEGALETFAIVRGLAMPIAAFGFLVSTLDGQLFDARALERMALATGDRGIGGPRLRDLVREALDDPSLELRLRRDGQWCDVDGAVAALPEESQNCCVVEVEAAAIICDPALKGHRRLVRAAATWVAIAMDREHLNAMLEQSIRAVENSRRRLATAAATERRRIERDLHDGAQQRLVTLRVQLELADEELRRDPVAGTERLHALGPSIDAVIDEVRSLARGIFPPLLADAGLVEALRAVADRQAIPVMMEADGSVRYPLEVESAVYFCCLEALQNATKHSGTDAVTVAIETQADRLRFSIRDEGCGFAPGDLNGGAGMTNMRDRIAAVQGSLDIDSAPGRGTRVTGEVPAFARS